MHFTSPHAEPKPCNKENYCKHEMKDKRSHSPTPPVQQALHAEAAHHLLQRQKMIQQNIDWCTNPCPKQAVTAERQKKN